jgi:hypothetical protein
MNMTRTPKLVAAAAAGTLLLGSAAAVAATAPSSTTPTTRTVHIWVTPGKGAVDKILLTGAIGDYGTATTTDKSGKVDTNGDYVKIHLQHGMFVVDAVPFNKKASSAQPHVNPANCSIWLTVSGRITIYDGTGDYTGIKGNAQITTSFAGIAPRFTKGPKKGQCDMANNAAPLAQFNAPIVGEGPVTFGG